MAPGVMGRFSERLHLKTSPTKNRASANQGAPTPSNPSPRIKSPRKHLNFGRSAISKATNALKSSKKLAPEPALNDIFSSPLRPQLDNAGKPACVRYIVDYLCGHIIIDQHPCAEHDPAFCLDDGHCITANTKKTKKCNECQIRDVAKMLDSTATSFPKPFAPPDHPMMSSAPAARAVIKARIEKRIEELGPLGGSNSNLQGMHKDKDEITKSVAGPGTLLTESQSGLRNGVTNTEQNVEKVAGLVPLLRVMPLAELATKLTLGVETTAANRAVSDSRLFATDNKDKRFVSASFRPLPPLPTPVNFDAEAMVDKAYRGASQIPTDSQLGTDAAADHNEDENGENGENDEADTTQYVSFVERDGETNEYGDSTIYNGEDDTDISTLIVGNCADDYDPFVDHDHHEISGVTVRRSICAERPLPPIPSKCLKRHTMPSPGDSLSRLFVAPRDMQNMAQSGEQVERSSPIPHRDAPNPPSPLVQFADFDFCLEYKRGEKGYTGRMGLKGSGDDFNKDWKLEHPTRNYSKDNTATGDLWENKHGYGYSGLKRYLLKMKAEHDEKVKQGGLSKYSGGESINFSSLRTNKDSTIWSRRWVRNVGRALPAPILQSPAGAGKTNLDAIIKKPGGETQIFLKSAKQEKYNEIPWDRTMIGCAL